jgi:hypothetical protein
MRKTRAPRNSLRNAQRRGGVDNYWKSDRLERRDVCYWPLADMIKDAFNVRLRGQSRDRSEWFLLLLMTQSGHNACFRLRQPVPFGLFDMSGFFQRGALGTLTILAVQVREQEHQWKRKRSNNRSNPRPDFEGTSSTLSNPAGKIDTTDKQRDDYDGAHRSKLRCCFALSIAWRLVGRDWLSSAATVSLLG